MKKPWGWLLCLLALMMAPGTGMAQTTLRIFEGSLHQETALQAAEQLPDIAIRFVPESAMDRQTLYTQLMTGELGADILALHSDAYDIQQMVSKGYLRDLTDSSHLLAFARDSLQAFQPLIWHEDRLYLIPTALESYYLAANLDGFQAIGQAVPTSLPQLLELAAWWSAEGYQQHSAYSLFDTLGVKGQLKAIIHSSYVDGMLGNGLPLRFDMDGYGAMMRQVDQLDVSGYDDSPDPHKPRGIEGQSPLLTRGWGYKTEHLAAMAQDRHTQLLSLSVDGALPGQQLARGSMLAIPASCPQGEAALRFLNAYVAKLPPAWRAGISRTWLEPIPNPRYEQERLALAAALDKQRLVHQQAEEGPAKREQAESLRRMEAELDLFDQQHRDLLSREALEGHQALMEEAYLLDSLSIVQHRALAEDDAGFHTYAQGAITLEQYMAIANDRIRLMLLEAQ